MPHKEIGGIPSVTQIIGALNKPWLHMWYGKYGTAYCEKIKTGSQRIGSRIHLLIEANLRSGRKPKLQGYTYSKIIKNFDEWKERSGFTYASIEPEEPLRSKIYCYQGTYDAIGYLKETKDQLWICDWKTSNQVDETFGLQLSAYAWLYGESNGWSESEIWSRIPNGLAVRLDKKTGKVEPHVYDGLQHYFEVFKSLILPYQFMTKTGGWEKPKEQK